MAVRHMKRLESIRKALLDMAAEWGDVDECFVGSLSDLAERCSELRAELDEVYPGRGRVGGAA